jgi:hypothetical protein
MWKEAVVAYFKELFLPFPVGTEETTRRLIENNRFPDRYLNPGPNEYEAGHNVVWVITSGRVKWAEH